MAATGFFRTNVVTPGSGEDDGEADEGEDEGDEEEEEEE